MSTDEAELHITPLYVLKKLEEHQKECSARWWAVMKAIIANLVVLVIGMGGMILTLLTHAH